MRELSDIETAVVAIEENQNRANPNVIERAKGYLRLKELLDADDQGSTWNTFDESHGFARALLRQLARLLELREKLQTRRKAPNAPWKTARHSNDERAHSLELQSQLKTERVIGTHEMLIVPRQFIETLTPSQTGVTLRANLKRLQKQLWNGMAAFATARIEISCERWRA